MAVGLFVNSSSSSSVGSSISTAMIMKTGQTVSFNTGDDGDLEAGRDGDFFTLPYNNPFGNNKRLTGITGGYQLSGTYYDKNGIGTTSALAIPDDIVIDWSSLDAVTSKVLGYKRTLEASQIASLNISSALAASIGSYTSGWRMVNFRELTNIMNLKYQGLNYEPFGITISNTRIRTSTNSYETSGYRWWWDAPNSSLLYTSDGNALPTIIVRTFSVSGTTLT